MANLSFTAKIVDNQGIKSQYKLISNTIIIRIPSALNTKHPHCII